MPQVMFAISDEAEQTLEQLAAARNMPATELLREAVEKYLAEQSAVEEEAMVAAFREAWYESDTEEGRRLEEQLDDIEEAVEGFRQGWRQAMRGEGRPIDTLWDELDEE